MVALQFFVFGTNPRFVVIGRLVIAPRVLNVTLRVVSVSQTHVQLLLCRVAIYNALMSKGSLLDCDVLRSYGLTGW